MKIVAYIDPHNALITKEVDTPTPAAARRLNVPPGVAFKMFDVLPDLSPDELRTEIADHPDGVGAAR